MEFEPIYGVVFRHIFGSVAVVRSMLAGNRLAKREGFDCVTFEGVLDINKYLIFFSLYLFFKELF